MRKYLYAVMALTLIGLASCGNRNNKKQVVEEEAIIVSDTRSSDCEPGDGDVWSAMNGQCVKLSEVGIPMISVENPDMNGIAYLLFSADSTKVEVFVKQESTDILDRRQALVGPVWNVKDDDTKNVRMIDGNWVIEQRGKVIYRQLGEIITF